VQNAYNLTPFSDHLKIEIRTKEHGDDITEVWWLGDYFLERPGQAFLDTFLGGKKGRPNDAL
jgi:hypothetical protein